MSADRQYLPFQQRVIEEKADLDAKRDHLAAFFGSNAYAGLPQDEKRRLYRQIGAMTVYSEVLAERIAAF